MNHSVPLLLIVAAFFTTVIPRIPVIVPLILIEVAVFMSIRS
jgi:hypothetical protein